MKKLQDILISTRTMAVLLLVYAASMAYATFLENDYGTPTAKALIYEAKWFEFVMLLLILNFIGNISRYRPVSYTHLDVYKRQLTELPTFSVTIIFGKLSSNCLLYTSRCV